MHLRATRQGAACRRRRRLAGLATVAVLLVAGAGVPARATSVVQPLPAGDSGDRLVVRLERPSPKDAQAKLAASVGGRRVGEVRPGVFTLEVGRGEGKDALRQLRARDEVALAEADVRFEAAEGSFTAAGVVPNEECFTGCLLSFDGGATARRYSQDEMVQVGAPDAWTVTRGDAGILVAVLDSDIDTSQPDLRGKVIVGRTYVSSGDLAPDPEGHGTAVAGLISAQPDNNMGIAGLGWSTRVLSVRVLDSRGAGLATDIAKGVRHAADHPGVRVINLSLQQEARDDGRISTELADAIAYAQSPDNAQRRPVLVVSAAGNQGQTEETYPAGFPGVLSVTAVDGADRIAPFANRGPWVDMAAPGVGVLSLAPGCGDCWVAPTGTSFATPFVSAAAALVMAANPGMPAATVATRLESTADRVAGSGIDFRNGRLNVARAVGFSTQPPPVKNPGPGAGYWLAASDGGIFSYGSARFHGSTGAIALNRPIVGMAKTPSGNGYWLVASDGGIFTFGDAGFFGSTGSMRLNQPIVGMAPTATGRGYWLVASDGGIFSFGDGGFFGSTGSMRLNQPIVGMAPTPRGAGYWLVASDGGIFSFGDARFYGSTGSLRLNRPIVAMASTPLGPGYWLVASDGGIFAFGDAGFFGSTAGTGVGNVVAMATQTGNGYWLVGADGAIYNFGAAPFLGSLAGKPLNRPIVGLAVR